VSAGKEAGEVVDVEVLAQPSARELTVQLVQVVGLRRVLVRVVASDRQPLLAERAGLAVLEKRLPPPPRHDHV